MQRHDLNLSFVVDGEDLFIHSNSLYDYEQLLKVLNTKNLTNTFNSKPTLSIVPSDSQNFKRDKQLSSAVCSFESQLPERHHRFLNNVVKLKNNNYLNRYNNLDCFRLLESICRDLKLPYETYVNKTMIGLKLIRDGVHSLSIIKIEPKPKLCQYTCLYVHKVVINSIDSNLTSDSNYLNLNSNKYPFEQDYYNCRFLFNSESEVREFLVEVFKSIDVNTLETNYKKRWLAA